MILHWLSEFFFLHPEVRCPAKNRSGVQNCHKFSLQGIYTASKDKWGTSIHEFIAGRGIKKQEACHVSPLIQFDKHLHAIMLSLHAAVRGHVAR